MTATTTTTKPNEAARPYGAHMELPSGDEQRSHQKSGAPQEPSTGDEQQNHQQNGAPSGPPSGHDQQNHQRNDAPREPPSGVEQQSHGQDGAPPEPPSGDEQQNHHRQKNGAPPEPPSGDEQHDHHKSGAPPEPPSGEEQQKNEQKDESSGPKGLLGRGSDLKDAIKPKPPPPGGFDKTPLPDAPPGYTVRFRFVCAANLPPADFHTASSDPFLTATIKASNGKRHKEDPDLVHRTRTVRRTLEPEWDDEWVVANVPPSGFTLKCRMYDEDSPDKDDRLGNITVKIPQVSDKWEGIPPPGKEFGAKKRMISKRAFFLKGLFSLFHSGSHITPKLTISIEVLGRSDPPYAHMYTLGPTNWIKHYSPMIGRLAGTKVNENEDDDQAGSSSRGSQGDKGKSKSQKYDFQANEMQLQGPVPPKIYHRYVQFRPVIGKMFASTGLRGKVLNKALHKQHNRVYNFDASTEYGSVEPCSEEASLQFLRLAHFDEGARVFTYVLTLDGLLRFTETGKEFGIDLLSKHTMHSNVETYIACSGEFFVRRLEHPDASEDPEPNEKVHPSDELSGGPPTTDPPTNPAYYQLIIDNDSGTYRPDKSILPDLKKFLQKNLPGLGIIAMHWEDEELKKLKDKQRSVKKKEGELVHAVQNRSQSSISSAESELEHRDGGWNKGQKTKREAAFAAVENPRKIKEMVGNAVPHGKKGESSDK